MLPENDTNTAANGGKDRRRRARLIAGLVGGALAVTSGITLTIAVAGQEPAPPTPPSSAANPDPATKTATPSTTPSARRTPTSRRAPEDSTPTLEWARPVRISIPKVDVSAGLEDLGLDSNGVMETPKDPAKAGWFTPVPPPGVAGAAVIAGHVTWDRKPAVFFGLGDLRRGDRIDVTRSDGTTAVFKVDRIGQFPKKSFPTKAVYQQINHAGLRLITCGGVYDAKTHNYRDNLIVWATMTGSHQ